jgi:excisionase family DNA binding protein
MDVPRPYTAGVDGADPADRPNIPFRAMGTTQTSPFNDAFVREIFAVEEQYGRAASYDLLFLAFVRTAGRFGFVRLGPIVIDVAQVEGAIERSGDRDSNDYAAFSRLLMSEVRRSGRPRLDELHFLVAFMTCGKGLPARVFGELGVTVEAVERWLRTPSGAPDANDLMTPEEVADYLKVHVETVRQWVRSGRLAAYRLGGVRALRIRRFDVDSLLQRVESWDASDTVRD